MGASLVKQPGVCSLSCLAYFRFLADEWVFLLMEFGNFCFSFLFSGLIYVVNRFKGREHSGHVTLARGERSRLPHHASEML